MTPCCLLIGWRKLISSTFLKSLRTLFWHSNTKRLTCLLICSCYFVASCLHEGKEWNQNMRRVPLKLGEFFGCKCVASACTCYNSVYFMCEDVSYVLYVYVYVHREHRVLALLNSVYVCLCACYTKHCVHRVWILYRCVYTVCACYTKHRVHRVWVLYRSVYAAYACMCARACECEWLETRIVQCFVWPWSRKAALETGVMGPSFGPRNRRSRCLFLLRFSLLSLRFTCSDSWFPWRIEP